MPRPPKPLPEGAYMDPERIVRINEDHPDLGKYKIEVSGILEQERAIRMCKGNNEMPSNIKEGDPQMFKVFKDEVDAVIRNDVSKLIRVPGYRVKRKALIKDKLEFLDGQGNK